jgi:hypothetical protein
MKSSTGSIYAGLTILGCLTLIGAVVILIAIPATKVPAKP